MKVGGGFQGVKCMYQLDGGEPGPRETGFTSRGWGTMADTG